MPTTRLYETAKLPDRQSFFGPLTRARHRRTALLYGVVFTVSLLVALSSSSIGVRAFALGALLPGGGFLYFATGGLWPMLGHLALALGSGVLFLLALFLWVTSGNAVAPPAVWLTSALAAAAMAHHRPWPPALWLAPGLVIVLAGVALVLHRRRLKQALRNRERRHSALEGSVATLTPRLAGSNLPIVEELSFEELAVMRFLLDRGLQPVDAFDGFDLVEQFQFSAVRYAITLSSYALSLAQYTRMPAFRGYLSEAQQNLIDKNRERRVWWYWRLENAWGNLRFDADPIAPKTHDNVMYSGWYAAMIGYYASNNNDDRYNEPASLDFRESAKRQYSYDFPTLVQILADDFERSDLCLFACEPKFVYVVCNNFAGVGLRIHDRLYGTDYWSAIEPRFRASLDDEFMTIDGRLVTARSSRTGIAIPGMTSTMADAGAALYLHALLPEVARRTWGIVRSELLRLEHGAIHVHMTRPDHYDTGNYRRSNATTLGAAAATACEMGDHEVKQALLERIEADHPSIWDAGVRHHPEVSVIGHAFFFAALAGRANGILDMTAVGMPPEWRDGPLIERAHYPNALIARAVSDGRALEAVLYPGTSGSRETLGLSQLVPGARYRCRGAIEREIVANADGRAELNLDLDGRSVLEVAPAA